MQPPRQSLCKADAASRVAIFKCSSDCMHLAVRAVLAWQPRRRIDCPVMQITVVYKFGGSSVATADRMIEVAEIVCSFQDQAPVVVLSAMGKVTTATRCSKQTVSSDRTD